MKCPCCGAAELIHDTRDMPYTYKGEITTIPAVTGDFCPACGEVVLDREHGDRYSELMVQFNKQVNAAYVDPNYIVKVRRKLDLDQRDEAVAFDHCKCGRSIRMDCAGLGNTELRDVHQSTDDRATYGLILPDKTS